METPWHSCNSYCLIVQCRIQAVSWLLLVSLLQDVECNWMVVAVAAAVGAAVDAGNCYLYWLAGVM